MCKRIKEDIKVVMEKDPAARSKIEVFFTYSGIRALYLYRMAHWFYDKGFKFLARALSQRARNKTGIEIHPAATIGRRLFIDHGIGIVIGETTEIGDNCSIYQGVTLGGTGKDTGKRHPTIKDNVMISAGATVLGPVIVGSNSKIGAGAVVLSDVPDNSTVVGIPGRVVKMDGKRTDEMDQKLPDPVLEEFRRLHRRIQTLEEKSGFSPCSKSLADEKHPLDERHCEASEECVFLTCSQCREKIEKDKPKTD